VSRGTLLTRLRPAGPEEAALLEAWDAEPRSPFEDWSGPQPVGACIAPAGDGGGRLVVTDGDGLPIGTVSWRPVFYGPNLGSKAMEIGISLLPSAQGRGHGARAQRMVVRYLFSTTSVHRVQASTDVDNTAEQKALERAGFVREGVLRGAQWRQGAFHDLVSYGVLRDDA
jgi:RimJ/RimL family protein N-acetyltransferase